MCECNSVPDDSGRPGGGVSRIPDVAGVVWGMVRHGQPVHWVAFTESTMMLALLNLCSAGRVHAHLTRVPGLYACY